MKGEFEIGDKVINTITSEAGVIAGPGEDEGTYAVAYDDGGEGEAAEEDLMPAEDADEFGEPDPDDFDAGPAEEDYVIGDARGGKYAAGVHGHKHLGDYRTLEEAYQAVKDHAGAGWRPNVWMISDHGNAHLIEDFPWDTTIELG